MLLLTVNQILKEATVVHNVVHRVWALQNFEEVLVTCVIIFRDVKMGVTKEVETKNFPKYLFLGFGYI